jgi:hypothetical protein
MSAVSRKYRTTRLKLLHYASVAALGFERTTKGLERHCRRMVFCHSFDEVIFCSLLRHCRWWYNEMQPTSCSRFALHKLQSIDSCVSSVMPSC